MPTQTPDEQLCEDTKAKIRALLASLTPPGKRFSIEGYPADLAFHDLRLTCDGADPLVGYYCVKEPGHSGRCWCSKGDDFDPDTGGASPSRAIKRRK